MSDSSGTSGTTSVAGLQTSSGLSHSTVGETTFFVLLLFFGIHTAVSIMPGGQMLVPYVLSFVAALGILSNNIRRIEPGVFNWFVLLTGFITALAVYISIGGGGYFSHLRSSAQFVYSVMIGYAAFLGLTVMGRERAERIFFWVSLFMIVGAALEIYGPIKPLSDWFRENFNAWYGFYASNARDVLSYGGYRPKFFASEPSLLGLNTGLALFIWLSAKRSFTPPEVLLAAFITIFAFFLIRSPNLLFGPLAFLLLALLPKDRGVSTVKRFAGKLLVAGYAAAVALFPPLALYLTLTVAEVPAYMKTISFFERIDAPFLITIDTLRSYPLFGIGLGDDDRMNLLALQMYNDLGMLSYFRVVGIVNIGQGIGNIFWQYWIFFGLIGGIVLGAILVRLFKMLRVPHHGVVIFCVTSATLWQGFGGVNTPLTWFVLFVVAAASKLRGESPAALEHLKAA